MGGNMAVIRGESGEIRTLTSIDLFPPLSSLTQQMKSENMKIGGPKSESGPLELFLLTVLTTLCAMTRFPDSLRSAISL